MKRSIILLLSFVLIAGSGPGFGQQKKGEIRLEFYGGLAGLDPADLNAQAVYDRGYINFSRDEQHSFYHSLYGGNYTYTREMEGSFPEIKQACPVGVRLKYHLTPSIALSLGFQYLRRSRLADVNAHYEVRAVRYDYLRFYDQYRDDWRYFDYTLSVKGYAPMVGLHLTTRSRGVWQLEGFLGGGPLFATCLHSQGIEWRRTSYNGYWQGSDTFIDIRGKGTAVAFEAGARINIQLFKDVDFFVEGGYAYQVVKEISGPAIYEYQAKDLNAEADREVYNWQGDWVMETVSSERYWGHFQFRKPTVYYDGLAGAAEDFDLDLSGFRLKLGLSFKI
jgi:hypothetical protein